MVQASLKVAICNDKSKTALFPKWQQRAVGTRPQWITKAAGSRQTVPKWPMDHEGQQVLVREPTQGAAWWVRN